MRLVIWYATWGLAKIAIFLSPERVFCSRLSSTAMLNYICTYIYINSNIYIPRFKNIWLYKLKRKRERARGRVERKQLDKYIYAYVKHVCIYVHNIHTHTHVHICLFVVNTVNLNHQFGANCVTAL